MMGSDYGIAIKDFGENVLEDVKYVCYNTDIRISKTLNMSIVKITMSP